MNAAEKLESDFVVRVTGDCPLIPAFLITKHIKIAGINRYDYTSNVCDEFRTAPDGLDCEVLSKKLLNHLSVNATNKEDKEHVTSLIRRGLPPWASVGHVVSYFDLSDMKLSVDTEEDLERVRHYYGKVRNALKTAENLHGKSNIHRL